MGGSIIPIIHSLRTFTKITTYPCPFLQLVSALFISYTSTEVLVCAQNIYNIVDTYSHYAHGKLHCTRLHITFWFSIPQGWI